MATYIMAKFENRGMLSGVLTKLEQLNEIERWDAVDGYYQMIIKLSGDNNLESDISSRLPGLEEITSCEIILDNEPNQPFNNNFCHSYLLLETEDAKRDEVRKKISELDFTLFCNLTKGKFDLIAILSGKSFDTLDRIINDQINHLDGVIRLKQDRIISSIRK